MASRSRPSSPGGSLARPRQARARRTRRRILDSAVACFEERGYDETTTAAIARRAGIAVGTLYGHFRDKRSILLELIDGTLTRIADHVVEGLDPESWRGREDPGAVVRQLIDAVFHARTFNPGMQRILWERYFKDAGFRAAVEAIEDRIRSAIERFLAGLKEEGRLRIDDVRNAAFVIYTSMEWTTARLTLSEADADRDAAAEVAADMVSRLLFAEEEPGAR